MRPLARLVWASIALAPLPAQPGAPDRDQSRYWESTAPVVVPGFTVLHAETIVLTAAGNVFVEADGTLAPVSWPTTTRAWVRVSIDGTPVTNLSLIDWNRSLAPQPHAFNAVGCAALSAGPHVVALEADTQDGCVQVGAPSTLEVFVNPASTVVMAQLSQDSPAISVAYPSSVGANRCLWTSLPWVEVLRLDLPRPIAVPVYAFASGRAYLVQSAGDAMFGFFPERPRMTRMKASWSVTDLYPAAELQAPFCCQGIFWPTPKPGSGDALILGATEFPPSYHSSKPFLFRVGGEAAIVAMYGDLQVHGSAGNTATNVCFPICVAGTGSGCHAVGQSSTVSASEIEVPPGHDGRVLIVGKARCQGNTTDQAAHIWAQLRVDGTLVGARAEQGLAGWLGGWDAAVSQRIMSVSWLATGQAALSPGKHRIEMVMGTRMVVTPPSTTRISAWDDDPFLVWID